MERPKRWYATEKPKQIMADATNATSGQRSTESTELERAAGASMISRSSE